MCRRSGVAPRSSVLAPRMRLPVARAAAAVLVLLIGGQHLRDAHAAADAAVPPCARQGGGRPANCSLPIINADFTGNDIETLFNVPSFQYCCQRCSQTDGCVLFSWDGNTQECWMRGSGNYTLNNDTDYWTGLTVEVGSVCTTPLPGYGFYGGNLLTLEGFTYGQCCDECRQTTDCGAFTWHNDGACYLKYWGAWSAIKPCDICLSAAVRRPT